MHIEIPLSFLEPQKVEVGQGAPTCIIHQPALGRK